MKTIVKLTFTLLLLQLSITAFSKPEETDTLNAPKKALILTQSYEPRGTYFTVMDLQNNELVILFYGSGDYTANDISYFMLRKVLRTGIILDPEQQKKIRICNENISRQEE